VPKFKTRKYFSFTSWFSFMFGVILFTIFFDPAMAAAQTRNRDLVIGALFGKIDPDHVIDHVESGYYPLSDENIEVSLEMVERNHNRLIYKILYPGRRASRHPRRLVFQFFESERSLAAAMITDKIDFTVTESDEIAEEIAKSTKSVYIHHRFKDTNFVKMLAYNNKNLILKDSAVRKALTFAIDRKYILSIIFKSRAFYANGPISEESENHMAELKGYKYNPREALSLLHNSNWRDQNRDGILDKNNRSFRVTIIYDKGALLEEQIARQVKIDWNKIGVDVVTIPLGKKELKKRIARRDYEVILMGFIFGDDFESFRKYFYSTSINNFLGYHNSTTDKYIDQYHNVSLSSRVTMFQAIQSQISKDYPAAFLFFPWLERYIVNTSKFNNYRTRTRSLLPFVYWNCKY